MPVDPTILSFFQCEWVGGIGAAHDVCVALSKKDLLEQWTWVGGGAVAVAGAVGAVAAWVAKLIRTKSEAGGGAQPNTNVNVTQVTQAPHQHVTVSVSGQTPLRSEGEILGAFHDLPPDQKRSLWETLTKLHGAPAGETKAENEAVVEAVDEAFAGDLTDIQEVLNRRYQRLAARLGPWTRRSLR